MIFDLDIRQAGSTWHWLVLMFIGQGHKSKVSVSWG